MLDKICLRRAFLSSFEACALNVLPYSGLMAASARCVARRSCASTHAPRSGYAVCTGGVLSLQPCKFERVLHF